MCVKYLCNCFSGKSDQKVARKLHSWLFDAYIHVFDWKVQYLLSIRNNHNTKQD